MPPSRADERAAENGARYERSDVRLRAVLALGLGVALIVAASQVGLWFLMQTYYEAAARRDSSLIPLSGVDRIPPPPRLQPQPIRDYAEFYREQQARLSTFGWRDRDQGIVHIPVGKAMDIVLERGLPKSAASASTDRRGSRTGKQE
jgi:hypothetical protein